MRQLYLCVVLLCVQDFITRLLERKPAKRLGMLAGKAEDVKQHPWFNGFDWAGLESRKALPPRKPKVQPNRSMRCVWAVDRIGLRLPASAGMAHVVSMLLCRLCLEPAGGLKVVLTWYWYCCAMLCLLACCSRLTVPSA